MGLLEEISKTLAAAGSQLTNTGKTPHSIHFSNTFRQKAKDRGLTEADAKDVMYHGEQVNENMMVKTYNGYEICVYFFVDGHIGKTIVTSIWKREQR